MTFRLALSLATILGTGGCGLVEDESSSSGSSSSAGATSEDTFECREPEHSSHPRRISDYRLIICDLGSFDEQVLINIDLETCAMLLASGPRGALDQSNQYCCDEEEMARAREVFSDERMEEYREIGLDSTAESSEVRRAKIIVDEGDGGSVYSLRFEPDGAGYDNVKEMLDYCQELFDLYATEQ